MGTATAVGLVIAACAVVGANRPSAWAEVPSPLWVAVGATHKGGGTSCTEPGYGSIQAAINAASSGQPVDVCAGIYPEQLQITKSVAIEGHGDVVVRLPAGAAESTTACDKAIDQGDQDAISVCGHVTVSLTGIVINAAWPAATCSDALYGILVAGGATLDFEHSRITAAGAVPLNGCQGGVGIGVGDSIPTPEQVGHLVLSDSTVAGYQKDGIAVDGSGSTASITGTTVTGIGPTTQIAQNGIQVSDGASAVVAGSTISGDECDYPKMCGADGLTQTQAAGVAIFGTDAAVTVSKSVISDSDAGAYYQADPAGPPPARPETTFAGDQFRGDRFEAVQLDQGSALVDGCTLTGGDVGVEVIQYAGQTFGVNSVVKDATMRGQTVASVDVLSDRAAGDESGHLLVTGSLLGAAPVLNNSTNIRVEEFKDS
jgi:hypothetical protein